MTYSSNNPHVWSANQWNHGLRREFMTFTLPQHATGYIFSWSRHRKWSLDQWNPPTHFISSHMQSFPVRFAYLQEASFCLCSQHTLSSAIIWSSKPWFDRDYNAVIDQCCGYLIVDRITWSFCREQHSSDSAHKEGSLGKADTLSTDEISHSWYKKIICNDASVDLIYDRLCQAAKPGDSLAYESEPYCNPSPI